MKNITNKLWNPRQMACGYSLVAGFSADIDANAGDTIVPGRDASHMLLS